MEARSKGDGVPVKPSIGVRSCAAETEQLPCASQSQSRQNTRLSVEQLIETGADRQPSQICERWCLPDRALAA